jgi:hypothetical protein
MFTTVGAVTGPGGVLSFDRGSLTVSSQPKVRISEATSNACNILYLFIFLMI